ncbi:MAG: hypothetical protein R3195_00790 [Gemmatimonadota bacterium]|nr:hypothetical protein [Gemmatimonadota bacterium]
MSLGGGGRRRAVAAYVRGHDRVWSLTRMRGIESDVGESGIEWSDAPVPPRFGVGVAREIEFHRGPGRARATNRPKPRGGTSDG